MRMASLLTIAAFGSATLFAGQAAAQVSATIHIGQQPRSGNEVVVYPYSSATYGDWHTADRRWQPVRLYQRDGHFYRTRVSESRPVGVYRWHQQYFLPPRDATWQNHDRRYNYRYRPDDAAYNVVNGLLSMFVQRPPPTWGSEIVVNPYSPTAYGDWHTAYRRWQPVTVYFADGHYFPRRVRGSRPVSVYRWNNQYFLPPQQGNWANHDRRFNGRRRPTSQDYRAVQRINAAHGSARGGSDQ
ncbi:MAG: hypothetical protein ACREL5_00965 [Gemmatimonadales bacterium]